MKHLINKAVLDAIIECGGSQKKLAKKLGINRNTFINNLDNQTGNCSPHLRYKIRVTYPIIPDKEYEKILEVESNQLRFCKKLIWDFLKKGKVKND